MKTIPANRIFTWIVMALVTGASIAAAAHAAPGDEPLPAHSFLRIGTTKLRHGSQILSLAYSPNGQMLAVGGGNDPLRLWNPKTGEVIREFNEPWVTAVAFTPSGETMLFASLQKNIRLWSFANKKEFGRLEGHKAAVKALAIAAADTSNIIVASGSQDGAIFLWDWNTKSKIKELKNHTDEVTALVYTPDNSLLISASSDHSIILWTTDTNKAKLTIDAGCGVHALAISADGKTLFSAGDDNLIRRWDVATGKQTGTFKGHEGIVVSVIVKGDQIVSGALDRTIRFWDAESTKQLRSLPRRQGDCNALALTKDSDFLATGGTNSVVRIFEAGNGKEVILAPGPEAGLTNLLTSPDRKFLAASTLSGQIVLWDAAGKLLRSWDSKHTGDILLAYSPDGKTLASAADTVRLWNPATGDEITQLPTKEPIASLAFSPDSKTLALGMRTAQIDLWDIQEKKIARSFKYEGTLHAIAWAPSGKYLAAAGMGKIMVWQPENGVLFKTFDGKEGAAPVFPLVASLVFSPDGRTLAAGCFDATIRLYNLQAKNPTGEREQIICEGHLSMPYSIAFSSDGRTLVSGSFDRTVRLWETFSGRQISQFKGHVGAVMGVAFSADNLSVYSGGTDAVIYQWDVPGLTNNGKLPELTLTAQELDTAWTTLSSEDTQRGHEAMWRATANGKSSITNMVKNLYLVDPDRVKKLFKDIDSNVYATRLSAMSELARYGRWMEGRYDEAIAHPPSLEYKRRVETLKEKLAAATTPSLAQERLRARRFMLMCEQIGGPEAIDALQKLSEKGPEEELREEAKGSLQRLKVNSK